MRAPKLNVARRGLVAWLAPLLVLTVGGCLLPQPDTPPIGPPGAMSKAAPEVKRPTVDMAVTTPSPAPSGAAPMATTLPAAATAGGAADASSAPPVATGMPESAMPRLEGRVTGATVTRVTAVPEAAGQPGALVTPEVDGRFSLALAPGRYRLELTVASGVIVATPVIEVTGGEPLRLVVTVSADRKSATARPDT